MKKLFIKITRDIKKSLGQFCAITIVSAIGVMLLTGISSVYNALYNTTDKYYESANLSDLSIRYVGIDPAGIEKIKVVDGVTGAYGRYIGEAHNLKNSSSFLVHSVTENQNISIPVMDMGVLPAEENECMVNTAYAEENQLFVGDVVKVSIADNDLSFTITGLFNTAEYIFHVNESTKALLPNHKEYGLLYVADSFVTKMQGSLIYNQVLVTLEHTKEGAQVVDEILAVTEEYGFSARTFKEDQISYKWLNTDIVTLGSVSVSFPYVFFLVASLIIFISMSRTVESERNQIGIMKALGLSSSTISLHYITYSVYTGVTGGIIGNVLGIFVLPEILLSVYTPKYTFPEIEFSGQWKYIVLSIVVLLIFGITASFISVRKKLKEVPAQCMRPLPPKKIKKTWIEKRTWLWKRLSYKNKLVFRNVVLNKKRVLLSAIGIIGCTGLLISGFGLNEATNSMLYIQFDKIQMYDAVTTVAEPVEYSQPTPFDYDNVIATDKVSTISVITTTRERMQANKRLYILDSDNTTVQLYNKENQKIEYPKHGISVPYKFAEENNIKSGDTLTMALGSSLYGNRTIEVKVESICVLYVTQDLYTSYEYLESLGIDSYVNGYYLKFEDAKKEKETVEYLKSVENIKTAQSKEQLLDDMGYVHDVMNTLVYVLIFMSALLALAVIFNISSINIFDRRRDIATLKVLGYHKKEINRLIHIENYIVTSFGCLGGAFFGAILHKQMLLSVMTGDLYLPYYVSASMVIISVVLAFVFTALANLLLKGKIAKIDMVESLKSVE
ncbi:UNVERIFIED_CONTAM: putative ABC transport system permease protein [Acetivibrio alkalicellulosi]